MVCDLINSIISLYLQDQLILSSVKYGRRYGKVAIWKSRYMKKYRDPTLEIVSTFHALKTDSVAKKNPI